MKTTILSFDPGAGATGWAYSIYDHDKKRLYVNACGLLEGRRLLLDLKRKTGDLYLKRYGTQFCQLEAFYVAFKGIMEDHDPDVVISEAPFVGRFPKAFTSLSLIMDRIRSAAQKTLDKRVEELAPTLVKKAVFGKGTADKEDMKAVFRKKDVTFNIKKDLTEHEIDAVSVAYAWIQKEEKL